MLSIRENLRKSYLQNIITTLFDIKLVLIFHTARSAQLTQSPLRNHNKNVYRGHTRLPN